MGEIIRDIIDLSHFDKTQVASYDLSILLGVDRFFCAVKNTNQVLVRLAELNVSGKEKEGIEGVFRFALDQSDFLKLRYRSVRLIHRNTRFTLLPKRLYKEGEEHLYLRKSAVLSSDDKLVVEAIGSTDMLNVFAVERGVWDTLKGYYPVSDMSHSMSSLISAFLKYPASKGAKRLLVEVGTGSFQIVFLDGEEVLFANYFSFGSPEDFIYYIMMVFDQFRLKPENCPVFLAGIIQKDADLYKILFRYVRHIHFVSFPGNLIMGKSVDSGENHFYFNLFGLW